MSASYQKYQGEEMRAEGMGMFIVNVINVPVPLSCLLSCLNSNIPVWKVKLGTVTLWLSLLASNASGGDRWVPNELPKAVEVLKKSTDPRELEREAIWVASSGEPDAINTLVKYLQDPDFLKRLKSDKSLPEAMQYVRVFRILRNIARNGGADAESVYLPYGGADPEAIFLRLGKDRNFTQDPAQVNPAFREAFPELSWPKFRDSPRKAALIDAMGYVPHPSDKLIEYLDKQSGFNFAVMRSLARLGTKPALAAVEKRFQETKNGKPDYCTSLIPGRNSPGMVKLYERLILAENKDKAVKNRLVQTLFDFQKAGWYQTGLALGMASIEPPPRSWASTEVLRELLSYADKLDKSGLTQETLDGIKTARKEIEAIIASRKDKK